MMSSSVTFSASLFSNPLLQNGSYQKICAENHQTEWDLRKQICKIAEMWRMGNDLRIRVLADIPAAQKLLDHYLTALDPTPFVRQAEELDKIALSSHSEEISTLSKTLKVHAECIKLIAFLFKKKDLANPYEKSYVDFFDTEAKIKYIKIVGDREELRVLSRELVRDHVLVLDAWHGLSVDWEIYEK